VFLNLLTDGVVDGAAHIEGALVRFYGAWLIVEFGHLPFFVARLAALSAESENSLRVLAVHRSDPTSPTMALRIK
jgi:hypothetical protein